jgi:hypothetical protein
VSYPVVIVRQNGKDRFCVDYRSLNKYTKPHVYPMQRSDEMFEALAGKQVFSSLDAARGYHQISIKPDHRWKTAFITHRGLFEYKTMPFGLKTAPAVFQRFRMASLADYAGPRHSVISTMLSSSPIQSQSTWNTSNISWKRRQKWA